MQASRQIGRDSGLVGWCKVRLGRVELAVFRNYELQHQIKKTKKKKHQSKQTKQKGMEQLNFSQNLIEAKLVV